MFFMEVFESLLSLLRWERLVAFVNSQFLSSLLGALAGAFAGATAAHKIAEKSKEREALMEQLRATNSAIMASYLICNAFLGLKKQQVSGMHQQFSEKSEELKAMQANPNRGHVFEFVVDLRKVYVPKTPLEVLNREVYETLNINGRPIAAAASIDGAMASLQAAIEVRDAAILRVRDQEQFSEEDKANFYFGYPLRDGSVSTEFVDSLNGIALYVDDVIFFSSLLCRDLQEYGENVRERFFKRYKGEAPRVNRIDFSGSEDAGIFPAEEKYEDWLKGFKTQTDMEEQQSQPWYLKIFGKNP